MNKYIEFRKLLLGDERKTVYRVMKDAKYYAAKVLAETYILHEFKNEQNRITREIDVKKLREKKMGKIININNTNELVGVNNENGLLELSEHYV